jgi:hypothetical protein
MFLAALILIISTGLFFFYFQITCQKILRRKFEQDYYQAIVNANRLEFPAVRTAVEEFAVPVDYQRFRMTLQCDFLALTYLLKNVGNTKQRFTWEERLLMLYFRAGLFSLLVRHVLSLPEKPAVVRLTAVLQYFANVVGERVKLFRFGNLSASEYLLNL